MIASWANVGDVVGECSITGGVHDIWVVALGLIVGALLLVLMVVLILFESASARILALDRVFMKLASLRYVSVSTLHWVNDVGVQTSLDVVPVPGPFVLLLLFMDAHCRSGVPLGRVDGLSHVAHHWQVGTLLVEVHLCVVLVEVDVGSPNGVRLLDRLLIAEAAAVEVASNLQDLLRHVVQTQPFLAHALRQVWVVRLHGHQLSQNDVVLLLIMPCSLRGAQVCLP